MHVLTLKDLKPEEIIDLVEKAALVKAEPANYAKALEGKTLLMMFAKPSLRTRVSFETGMTQLGGHGIYYDISTSPMGKKETIADTAKTVSRYVDIVMARLFEHEQIEEMAENATVPIINGLTDFSHPVQILSDLLTIKEKKGKLRGLKLAYFGDGFNNVTHSLLYGCSLVGMNIDVASPEGEKFEPDQNVLREAKEFSTGSGSKVSVTNDANEAIEDADIIYTDSWMSYHIPKEQELERVQIFRPYQVTEELMKKAKPDAIFMNCLPAKRGFEQTAEVIDSPQSVVFDQAENRLHMQKTLMLKLLGKI